MKIINRFISSLLLSISFIMNASSYDRALIIAGDYWCPYNCYPDTENPGYLVEQVVKSLYIYNIDVEYHLMPWEKAIAAVKAGEVDAIIGISHPLNHDMFSTSQPVEFSQTGAFTANDTTWVYRNYKSFNNKKLGVVMDYTIDKDINHYVGTYYRLDPSRFIFEKGENAVISSIGNLITGDSDVFVEDVKVMDYYTKKNGLDRYVRFAGLISRKKLPLYIGFSKKTPEIESIIRFLEVGIRSLKSTGQDKSLREKYKMDQLGSDFLKRYE